MNPYRSVWPKTSHVIAARKMKMPMTLARGTTESLRRRVFNIGCSLFESSNRHIESLSFAVGRTLLVKVDLLLKRFAQSGVALRIGQFHCALSGCDSLGQASALRICRGQRMQNNEIAAAGKLIGLLGQLHGFDTVA